MRDTAPVPCYAMTVPGLEALAAQEIEQTLRADVKRTAPGLVVFRPTSMADNPLSLRTVEDVFLLLWGTDKLTFRAKDLDSITKWTDREPDWPRLLQIHHQIHPKPKSKPTYRLVAQMHGQHGYRRVDALNALAKGMEGKFPASWKPADENAAVEIWLSIDEQTAVCGLRLSDATMRHRTYKHEHLPASLRPVVAAAMVRLAKLAPHDWLLDPFVGAGTILAERLVVCREARVIGGDLSLHAIRAAQTNLKGLGQADVIHWDARQLPLANQSVDAIVSNPPFGKQLGDPTKIRTLYEDLAQEAERVLKPGGRIVLLVSDPRPLDGMARELGWRRGARHRLRLLGQAANLCTWTKS